MMRSRNVSGPHARGLGARGAVAAAILLATLSSIAVRAQAQAPAAAPEAVLPRGMSESVAAVVNDDIISTYDLAQRMRLLIATSGVQPTEQTLPQFQQEALVGLVDERLQLQELKRVEKDQKISIIASQDEVMEEVAGMAQQNNLKADAFLQALAGQGIGPETLYDQVRAQMSWQRWIRGRYGSRLRIGEDQIKATQARLSADSTKAQYEISEVFIDATRAGGQDAAMSGATQLVAQLQQGAPFQAVARQFSASATAATGGDAGWVNKGEMPAPVDAALEQLRPGQLSQPIAVKDGAYIIYLRDKRSGSNQTLVNLKQAAVALPATATEADIAAARGKLETVRSTSKGCADIEAVSAKNPGVVAGDLGEAEISDLLPEFAAAAQSLQVGELSAPIRTKIGLHVLTVCARRSAGEQALDHDQVENRLTSQQLAMISRRYMRDLRNSATIETR